MTLRKLLAFALSAALLAGCSGGSSGGGGGETPSGGGEASGPAEIPTSDVFKGETNQQTYPISSEKITLSYWYPHGNSIGTLNDFNDSEFFQWMEEKTNIHIDFVVPAVGEEANSFNQLFIADDLPDILYTSPATQKYRDGMDAAIEDGYVVDLRDYLDLMPNYVSWLNSIPTAKKDALTDTGKMYGFWSFWDNMESGYADQGISIRKDFLDKVGEEIPETYEDWERVLTKFKDELGIEAPYYTSKYGIDYGEFMAGYGVAPYFYQVDGTVKYGPMQDEYKEYLTMMHDWYEKGLLDPDFSTRQSTGVAADNDMILNDKIGALIDWGTRMTDAYISRGATNPDFYAVAAKQPKKSASDPDPAFRIVNNNFHDLQSVCILINAKSEHIEEAIRWVDSFYAKDVYLNANYGIDSEEGTVWYAAEDGHRIGDYDFRYSNPDGLDSATVAAKYWAKNPPVRVEAAQIEQMPEDRAASYAVWSTYESKNFIPTTVTMTTDESSEYSQYYTDLEAFVQENNVKFINGQRSLDEYDAYRDQLKSMGIETCIKLQQAALDRYNAR
ncbi:MAG: hypothetical protein E7190_05680 [Erysipelotrichaceae bacterium]|nr:hypothetical protein [Erysipelotrichaceae bacterium]